MNWQDNDEGYWSPPPNVYGNDGPVLSRRCRCGRILKLPYTVRWNEHNGVAPETRGNCSRCGSVKPVFLCWSGDCR